jgi:hypothetical protein
MKKVDNYELPEVISFQNNEILKFWAFDFLSVCFASRTLLKICNVVVVFLFILIDSIGEKSTHLKDLSHLGISFLI